MEAEAQYQRMITAPVGRLVTALAIPAVISMLITALYNLADTWFVSKLGTSASGAVGIVFSLMNMIQALGLTLGLGSGCVSSRLLGEQKNTEAGKIAVSAFAAAIAFGFLLAAFGICFLTPFMQMLGASATILPYARDYGFYILLGAPCMVGSLVANSLLRAEGHAKFAMIGLTVGGILNIFLDPLLIFTCNMGISGAALATALSQAVSFCILLSMYLRKRTVIVLRMHSISLSLRTYLFIIKNGFPSLCRLGLASVSSILLNKATIQYGDSAVASMSIVSKIVIMMFSASVGFGQGYQPVAGYNYGAGRYSRVRASRRFALKIATIAMLLCSIAVIVLADVLVAAFLPDNPEAISMGAYTLRIQCIVFPLVPYCILSNMTFQSLGKPFLGALLASCRQGILFIPLILIFPRCLGFWGIQITQAAADILTFILCVPFMAVFFRKMPTSDR